MKTFKYFTEAKMTRQHFQLIADVIASLELQRTQKELVADVIASLDVSKTIKKVVAEKFADAFEDTNPMFKRDLFIKATKKKAE